MANFLLNKLQNKCLFVMDSVRLLTKITLFFVFRYKKKYCFFPNRGVTKRRLSGKKRWIAIYY